MALPKVSKVAKSKTQDYQHKRNAICIVLYDQTGETLSPAAQVEAEHAMLAIAMKHNVLLSISVT